MPEGEKIKKRDALSMCNFLPVFEFLIIMVSFTYSSYACCKWGPHYFDSLSYMSNFQAGISIVSWV